ncbi:MAG: hypothetical protein GOP50_12745 [Candidatus Heimdallarchaeota archaeon]|nr:hypothetical protein [Candidatus Heimdallarchaeota archaeon]
MPILDDTKELIILELDEWEKLSELDLGELKPHSTGGNFQQRKIIVKQVRSLYDRESDTLYPYITYYNKKGIAKTERLVKCDKIIRGIFAKEDGSEHKGRYHSFLEVITAAQGLESLKQIRMAYTLDIYNWYEKTIKLQASYPRGIFPMPFLVRKNIGVSYDEIPNTIRNYYEIIPLDKLPS